MRCIYIGKKVRRPETLLQVSTRTIPQSPTKKLRALYVRMKILTEAGKKYADVPVLYPGRYFSVASVEGHTIHPDGTVIPFTGKPFQKEIYKSNAYTEKETFFTMPDVQVGSILEYRFVLRYNFRLLIAPEWRVQQNLFMRKIQLSRLWRRKQGTVRRRLHHPSWRYSLYEYPA